MGSGLSRNERHLLKETPFDKGEVAHLRYLFRRITGSRSRDCLEANEFGAVFSVCTGAELSNSVDVESLFRAVDVTGTGNVSFTEMLQWLSVFVKGSEEAKLAHMFTILDLDDSGGLDEMEMGVIYRLLKKALQGRGLSKEAAKRKSQAFTGAMLKEGHGEVTFEIWIAHGKRRRLVEILLGDAFAEVLSHFEIPSPKIARERLENLSYIPAQRRSNDDDDKDTELVEMGNRKPERTSSASEDEYSSASEESESVPPTPKPKKTKRKVRKEKKKKKRSSSSESESDSSSKEVMLEQKSTTEAKSDNSSSSASDSDSSDNLTE